ncbi:MAG: 1-(5-phosphoribosyl)-5-[(5-phosphoribosylamino)methylideneamino]imidazole-4-carboxamide isomerase [Alphaproteobacteria bacterium]|nr:1-(5-phosphoribosyl)-5-[(5-phosphoribosylamino)methylideneamino]imidazole-4-carboxamide isomerase [Alphaproteobacteria bacterium]
MILFPAIDLKGGACVRLYQGDMAQATRYNPDPADQARRFLEAGAAWLHVVDLDGAFAGRAVNQDAVDAIIAEAARHGVPVQLGGGIRDEAAIERWLARGLRRVILGTVAARDPALVKRAAKRWPGGVVVGIDARDGMVAVEGWAAAATMTAHDLALAFEDAGVAAIVFTDIARDGTLRGANVEATAALARALTTPVIASGGVGSLADLRALKPHEADGIAGVICGRALYDGRIDLAAAIALLQG